MNRPINSHLQTREKQIVLAVIGGFGARCPEDALRKETSPGFSDTDRENSWMIIWRDQPFWHKMAIGHPQGIVIR